MMKEIKMTQTDGEIYHVLGLEELILSKWLLHKIILRFNEITVKLPMAFSTELEQEILQFVWKHKRLKSQSNLEKEKWSRRNQPSWFQTILQSYRNLDSMVLAQKQKYRQVAKDRDPRDKPTYLWAPYLWQRREEYTMEKR